MKGKSRLQKVSISFFSIIMGMSGFTIVLQKAEQFLSFPFNLSNYILGLTVAIFIFLTLIYLLKIIRFKNEVKNEFDNPVMLSFFPTFSISLLLLSIAFAPISNCISKYLSTIGATLHFIFTLEIVSAWIQREKFEIKHMNPAWLIPIVGNLIIPLTWVSNISFEISWFFISIGVFFWIVLFIIFFYRIIFHYPLPEKLLPTFFILLAPPSFLFLSVLKLTGGLTEFSKVVYYFGLFTLILLISQLNLFKKIKTFYISWWAYSFPLTVLTVATIMMFHKTSIETFKYLSFLLISIVSILILFLIVKTIISIAKKELCIEEE